MFYDIDDFLGIAVSFFVGIILSLLICVVVFNTAYSVVKVDIEGNKYVSSDVKEIDGDYYYKNADGDLVKIEFYENDFKGNE